METFVRKVEQFDEDDKNSDSENKKTLKDQATSEMKKINR
jgi:hypothetical protein